MNKFEKKDLIKLTQEPLHNQYMRIISKVIEAVHATMGNIVLCFSGGKDSALLLDIYSEVVCMLGLSHIPINVAFANTTNETKNMRQYIPFFIKRCEKKYGVKIDFNEVKPLNNDNIISVMKREGLPFVSKSVSAIVRKMTKSMAERGITYDDIKNLHEPTIKARDALREMGLNDTSVLAMTGWSCERNDFGTHFVLAKQWLPLLDIKNATGLDICFSEKCCYYLKKEPLSRLNFSNVMTGEQAVESITREASWLLNGCNYRLPNGDFKSKPLGSVSLEAILYAINYRDIPLCQDYGKVFYCDKSQCWKCDKAQRTGCALCGFGIKFDKERFVRLQETEPQKVAYAFTPISQGGLGYLETTEYLNEYCGTNIIIPSI